MFCADRTSLGAFSFNAHGAAHFTDEAHEAKGHPPLRMQPGVGTTAFVCMHVCACVSPVGILSSLFPVPASV